MRQYFYLKLIFVIIISVVIASCNKEKENQPPKTTITSPMNGENIATGEIITISVEADDGDGNVTEVSYYVDGTRIGSTKSYPHEYEWNTSGEVFGNHTIKAIVIDDLGETTFDEIIIVVIGIAPVASFTVDKTTITDGMTIAFTDQSSYEPTKWDWDFGDGGTSTEQNPNHTYNKQGTYTVGLTVSNNFGNGTEAKSDYIEVGGIIDYDGNSYKTVVIGTQEWMVENLKVTNFPNGTAITLVTDNDEWGNLGDNDIDNAYCYYNNNANSELHTYGALYTYVAAKNACPTGWNLPSDEEWKTLEMYLGMSQSDADDTNGRGTDEGSKLKASSGWYNNGNGTDDYGFLALPGGYRFWFHGTFEGEGRGGLWWSSTEHLDNNVWYRNLGYDGGYMTRLRTNKSSGLSVRCLKNN